MSKQIIEINYNVPITESGIMDNDFLIQGVAINATITSNNHKFVAEELRSSANTLNGVPLLVDHDNSIKSIKGRVLKGEYDENNSRVNFKAKVVDSEIKRMIKDGLINSVSVGATVQEIEEGMDGILIPKGICFKELSLVAVPADAGATFTTSLAEAYKSNKVQKVEETVIPKVEEAIIETVKPEIKTEIIPDKIQEVITTSSEISNVLKGGIKMSEEIKTEEKAVVAQVDYSLQMKEMAETIKMLQSKIEAKEKSEALKSEVREEVKTESKYTIESGFGSIRGNSFTLVR